MKLKVTGLALAVISAPVSATEFSTSTGLGYQYGGIVGQRLSIGGERLRVNLALGLIGSAVLAEAKISDHITIAAGQTVIAYHAKPALMSLNYHFN
ncbi:MAG TPA: hypothetical protein VIC26_11120, partial [Marinagarivorans sp.]